PFLIAFILGPLLEDNFRQSMLMSGGALDILVRSPITWVFWTLTAVTVAAIVTAGFRALRPGSPARDGAGGAGSKADDSGPAEG
ncbi:MAG: hypothetical protein AAFQ84_05835, partial [Pseudomonadota bacterium]